MKISGGFLLRQSRLRYILLSNVVDLRIVVNPKHLTVTIRPCHFRLQSPDTLLRSEAVYVIIYFAQCT